MKSVLSIQIKQTQTMNNLTNLNMDSQRRKQIGHLGPILFNSTLYFIPNKDKIQIHI